MRFKNLIPLLITLASCMNEEGERTDVLIDEIISPVEGWDCFSFKYKFLSIDGVHCFPQTKSRAELLCKGAEVSETPIRTCSLTVEGSQIPLSCTSEEGAFRCVSNESE